MNDRRSPSAKILVHSQGLGAPNAEIVRKRAEEIALINGHPQATEEDWRQAKLELRGGKIDDGASDEMGMATMVSEQMMISSDVGHQSPRGPLDDERPVAEELIAEGMEEAEHDRMLAARREVDLPDEEDL